MSRIEGSRAAAVREEDVAVGAPPAAEKGKETKPSAAANKPAQDSVERHVPEPGSEGKSKVAPDPKRTEGNKEEEEKASAALTAGAMAQTSRPSPQAALEASRKAADAWMFTREKDMDSALDALGKLPPREYREALETLQREGALGKMCKEMTLKQQTTFVLQMEAKGLTKRTGGEAPLGAPLDPPARPALFENDAALPLAAREMLQKANVSLTHDYLGEHRAYLSRYEQEVMRAQSPADLRRIGPPLPQADIRPDFKPGDPHAKRFADRWTDDVTRHKRPAEIVRAYKAIENKVADMTGRMRAGTLGLKGSLEISKGDFSAGGTVAVTQYGQVTSDGKAAATVSKTHRSVKGSVSADTDGSMSMGVDFPELDEVKKKKAPVKGGVSVTVDADGEAKVKGQLGKAGVTVGSDGSFEARAGYAVSGFGPDGKVYGGVAVEESFGGVKVKGRLVFEAQLSNSERVRQAWERTNLGVFRPLPELEQGVPWSDLPAERRKLLETDGWKAESWNAEAGRASAAA